MPKLPPPGELSLHPTKGYRITSGWYLKHGKKLPKVFWLGRDKEKAMTRASTSASSSGKWIEKAKVGRRNGLTISIVSTRWKPSVLDTGLPIFSGPMESFCKQIGLWMKGRGMRWNVENVSLMAALVCRSGAWTPKAANCSERFLVRIERQRPLYFRATPKTADCMSSGGLGTLM